MATKLTTCAYCGNQELVRLAEGERFQLVCSACGAAAKDVAVLPGQPQPATPAAAPKVDSRTVKAERPVSKKDYKRKNKKSRRKYSKRKKDLKYWFKKVKDEIEDIFD